MPVAVLFVGQIMVVLVRVGNGVRMRRSVVSVRKRMPMRVRVLACKRIRRNDQRTRDHYRECGKVEPRQALIQHDERQNAPTNGAAA